MMDIAYFDCFAGISGDMTLGALVDSGISLDTIATELAKLDLQGYNLSASKVQRGGISGTKINVIITKTHHHCTRYKEIKELITTSGLSESVKKKSLTIFDAIATAESAIHATSVDDIHFHEVGAIDSIVDIVGSVIGMELLGVEKIFSSPVNVGSGTVNTAHGILPVPAPATIELLKEVPCYSNGVKAELTTPTGAAIISFFAEEFVDFPEMTVKMTTYGAGSYNPKEFPNMLRIILGSVKKVHDEIVLLETNIDDMNPEFYEYIFEQGFATGALDIFLTPIIMKKGRPATKISVLTKKSDVDSLTALLFLETSSFGIRIQKIDRVIIEREIISVSTPFGVIKVKIGKQGGKPITVSPEHDDCKNAAKRHNVPLKMVYEAAMYQVQQKGLSN